MKCCTDEVTVLRLELDAELRKTNPDTARIDTIISSILTLENRDISVPKSEIKAQYRMFRTTHPTERKQSVMDYAKIAACIALNLLILALTLSEQLK